MSDRLSTAVFVALLLFGAAGGGAVGTAGAADGVEPDRVVMAVTVGPDGDARWRVAYRFRLSDENASTAFEELRASIEANATAYRERFAGRMRRTVRAAENATGREMAVRNVTVRTAREELTEYGVVTYRFRWTGFAAVSGDRLVVGDAVENLYLDRRTTLILSWPDGYRVGAVDPDPTERRDGSVAWVGPTRFESGEPRLVVEPAPTTAGTATAGTPPSDTEAAGENRESGNAPSLGRIVLGGAVLAVGLGVGAALALSARRDGSGTIGAADAGTGGGAAEDEPLETPGERVEALLRAEGGRMKQARIAERLDWTAAKTSRVVSDLREAGEVETFRVGRENVVALAET